MRRCLVLLVPLLTSCGAKKTEFPFVRYILGGLPEQLQHRAQVEIGGVAGPAPTWDSSTLVDVPEGKPVAAGSPVKLTYDTPCGKRSVTFPLPAGTPNENHVVEVTVPKDLAVPRLTSVILDPSTTGAATLGGIALDPKQPLQVLDATCGATAKVAGADLALPPAPVLKREDEAKLRTPALFLTARAEQCFLDQLVTYGESGATRSEHKGARMYWLDYGTYDHVLEPVPKSITTTQKSTARTALTLCDG